MPYDRAWIMRLAHQKFRDAKRRGREKSFADCLREAWAAARTIKQQQEWRAAA